MHKDDNFDKIKQIVLGNFQEYNEKIILTPEEEVKGIVNDDILRGNAEDKYIAFGIMIKSNEFSYAIFENKPEEASVGRSYNVYVFFNTNKVFIKQDIAGDYAPDLLVEIYPEL